MARIVSLDWAAKYLPPSEAVLLSGGFDPLHFGHARYFQSASRIASDRWTTFEKWAALAGRGAVVVAVAPDAYVVRKHPLLQTLEQRMETVAAIRWVDYVVPQDDETAAKAILAVCPWVFLKGSDWQERGLPKAELEAVEAVRAEVRYVPVHPVSSSEILRDYFWAQADALSGRS